MDKYEEVWISMDKCESVWMSVKMKKCGQIINIIALMPIVCLGAAIHLQDDSI